MTTQTKILSFDEAKRAAAASRRSARAPLSYRGSSSVRESPASTLDFEHASRSAFSARVASSARQTSGTYRTSSARQASPARTSPFGPSSAARASESRQASSPRSAFVSSSRSRVDQTRRGNAWQANVWRASEQGTRSQHADERHTEEQTRESEQLSRFARFKKNRAKNKAERAFNKRYGGIDRATGAGSATGAAEAGPRAAVYKGEMGTAHRRAARMQNTACADPSRKRFAPSRFSLLKSPKLAACAAIATCLVFACVYLYPTARQYYLSVRECDRLQAEYAAIAQRNEAIQGDVDALGTSEGVEDRAHKELGWTKTGEHAATVRGLEGIEDESTFMANIVAGSTEAPETWYSVWLDPLFGVE